MTTATLTLTEFLLARIAEDEAVARAAWPERWEQDDDRNAVRTAETGLRGGYEGLHMGVAHMAMTVGSYRAEAHNAAHVARHDTARVLAECEAKREILRRAKRERGRYEQTGGNLGNPVEAVVAWETAVRILAAVYSDHPDYRSEWKP